MHIRAALGTTNVIRGSDGEGEETKDKSILCKIEGGLDYILFRNENLLIYTGGIGQIEISRSDLEDDENGDGSSLTLAGVLGASWLFTQNVSLGAEYRLAVECSFTKDENGDKTTEIRIGTSSAAFLLGFWF